MNDQNNPLMMDHEADGIRELDNKLPRWWVWLFNLSIIFAVVYLSYYHVFARGDLAAKGQMQAEYQAEMKIGNAIKGAAISKFEATIANLEPSTETLVIAAGKTAFLSKCAPCHRPDAGGLVGPNLTDDYWIHGPKFSDNVRTIWNGVKEKGMLAWKEQGMKPSEVIEVASYIYTLRGTKLETPGKQPENLAPANTGPSQFE
jgi:cytochrome c oxidase cbb3-type subunit III